MINRLLIIAQVIMIAMSEVGWPQVFFDRFFPILGSDFGLGALGIMQVLCVEFLSRNDLMLITLQARLSDSLALCRHL